MSLSRFVLFVAAFFLVLPAAAQQASLPEQKQSAPPRDAQAVTILQQAVAAAGGEQAVNAVANYTASGQMTRYQRKDETIPGTVTINARGVGQFRMDTDLGRGRRSVVISEGRTTTKAESGTISKYPPERPIPNSDLVPYKTPLFPASLLSPHQQIAKALSDTRFAIAYKGLVEQDGRSVHEIRVERILPWRNDPDPNDPDAKYRTVDFFLDTTTLQVVMTQEMFPSNIVQRIRYADYKLQNGVLIPFSLSEEWAGQKTWGIHLEQVVFNAGVSDSTFSVN